MKVFAIAALLAVPSYGEAGAQVLFGGHGSLTNLGTETVQVGETWGVGGRLGYAIPVTPSSAVVFEAVGDVFFPPCQTVECDLVGFQFNVLGAKYYNENTRLYAGIGFSYQDFAIEDDDSGVFVDDDAFGGNMIIGISWVAAPSFQPFFEVRFSALRGLREQAGGVFGFRVIPGAQSYFN
jgi:hypothetical protein